MNNLFSSSVDNSESSLIINDFNLKRNMYDIADSFIFEILEIHRIFIARCNIIIHNITWEPLQDNYIANNNLMLMKFFIKRMSITAVCVVFFFFHRRFQSSNELKCSFRLSPQG